MANMNPDGSLVSPGAFVAALKADPTTLAQIRASNAEVRFWKEVKLAKTILVYVHTVRIHMYVCYLYVYTVRIHLYVYTFVRIYICTC